LLGVQLVQCSLLDMTPDSARLSSADLEAQVLAASDDVRPPAHGAKPDDRKEIGGSGPVNEQWLHKQGFF
jgi:predicted flap endonuclease-1-like 5' DNA nuclease